MEADDIECSQHQATKYSRVNSNGTKMDTCKKGSGGGGGSGSEGRSNLEDKTELVCRTGSTAIVPAMNGTGVGVGVGVGVGAGNEGIASNRFVRQWQHSSRIIRVSRASGGKDRHSKVWTAKGPRDRRVRLSVTTAIQFYDLQDRLGYDQPSKAVEWLIKAASESINELPSLNNTNFPPETLGLGQGSDERRSVGDDSAVVEFEQEPKFVQEAVQQQQVASMSMSKSGCSSNNSETSKGSGLSLSRTEIRVKARERARERTAKDKEKENEPLSRGQTHLQLQSNNDHHHQHQQQHNVSSMSQASSFTQLLTSGISNVNDNAAGNSVRSPHHGSSNSNTRGRNDATSNHLQWLSSNCTTPMAGFFETGLMGLSTTRPNHSMQQLSQVMTLSPFSSAHNDMERQHQHHHPQHQHQHFPFMTDQHHHLIQVPNSTSTTSRVEAGVVANGEGNGGTDYNLNFSISSSSTTSGLAAGFNRGTLQSNSSSSPSLLSYLQRFSATDGGVSSLPFFLGGAPISPTVNNQHIHPYDPAGLQLCYGDHSDQKGKGKN